jgi:His Kinase A (phospho-acceptor) domain
LVPEAAAAASLARGSVHPVWLAGGPGTGAYEVARALHGRGDPLGFVSVRRVLAAPAEIEERLHAALGTDPSSDALSLYVERIERQSAAVQERVLRLSDEGISWQGRVVPVRLFAQSDEGCPPSEILPVLRHRLLALVVALPPLAARREDVPSIALALANRISRDLALPEPVIDGDALRRLAERDWPDNLEELGAVITRGLLAARGEPIDDFDTPRIRRTPSPIVEARPGEPKDGATGLDRREIEVVIAELAHELKNPMVTIKTFAENLDQLSADPKLREKFVGLTCEAVTRMDSFLDEILRFSRFSEPKLRRLSLTQALSHAIEANEAGIRERVKTNGIPAKVFLRVDEEQIAFALKSLLRGLCRETPENVPVSVDLSPSGDLVFVSGAGVGTQQKLRGALDHQQNGGGLRSLDFIMAETLIRRNGGSSRVVREQDQIRVRVNFPNLELAADAR